MTTRSRTPKRPPEPVTTEWIISDLLQVPGVHELAMEEAKRIAAKRKEAGCDHGILRVCSPTEVIVLNYSGQQFGPRKRGTR